MVVALFKDGGTMMKSIQRSKALMVPSSKTAMKIVEKLISPATTLQEVTDLILSDSGVAAQVLRLANSAYYGIPGGVKDVQKALQYIGLTTLMEALFISAQVRF